ncbi:MAG TPA: transposase [Propionibacteriaceae bacterium]|nr:transposase [Propionibacteriaceae bacterium]
MKGDPTMVIVGIDAHKRSHTAVAIDAFGRKLGQRTTGTTSEDHLALLGWAEQFGSQRIWAVEDCRHLSRRLEADLLGAGESIVRVPTKLMAHARDAARSYGKSDPIDALAVARAALRETDLPTAQLDGPARTVRLLADHRDHLIAERTKGNQPAALAPPRARPQPRTARSDPVAAQTPQRHRSSPGRLRRRRRPVSPCADRGLSAAHRPDPGPR